ncbi:phosphoadenosine phosphosulfate reductase family protein [Toxoplasma gondii CAST]|uniref:FAD synthase n=1 Tax=Toxoplasma gondii CAST TaxID=943122 RepID=A0A425HV40_TOXGO|nr:phosphoadenosine phosphosulfate reductase family protein [Toxoplasma gondii CAST]
MRLRFSTRGDGATFGLAHPLCAASTSAPPAVTMALVAAAAASGVHSPPSSPLVSPLSYPLTCPLSSPRSSSSSPSVSPVSAFPVESSSAGSASSTPVACTCSYANSVTPLCYQNSHLPHPGSSSTLTSTSVSSVSSSERPSPPGSAGACLSSVSKSLSAYESLVVSESPAAPESPPAAEARSASCGVAGCLHGDAGSVRSSAGWTRRKESVSAAPERQGDGRDRAACARERSEGVIREDIVKSTVSSEASENGRFVQTQGRVQMERRRACRSSKGETNGADSGLPENANNRGEALWSFSAFKESVALLRRIEAAIEEGTHGGLEPQRLRHASAEKELLTEGDKETEQGRNRATCSHGRCATEEEREEENLTRQEQDEMTPAVMAGLLRNGLELLVDAFRLFGPESVILSFNGGKDAVVALHLYRAALAKFLLSQDNVGRKEGKAVFKSSALLAGAETHSSFEAGDRERVTQSIETHSSRRATSLARSSRNVNRSEEGWEEEKKVQDEEQDSNRLASLFTGLPRPKAIYFHGNEEEFEEVADFVEHTANEFELDVSIYHCGLAEGVQDFSSRFSHLRPLAFVLGTREGDPNTAHLLPMQASSSWLPAFLRVHPLVGFRYGHIWHFIRHFALPYCVLYDRGYTSIGTKKNTKPNPHLFCSETGLYAPAYLLANWADERSGRN